MTHPLYQRLNDVETESILRALEEADELHGLWVRRLHSSLICHQPFHHDVFDEQAHTLCKFGQWYYHQAPETLREQPEFVALEDVHRRMHDDARMVANQAAAGETISLTDYDRFTGHQRKLSGLLMQLRDILREQHFAFDTLTGAMNRRAFFKLLDHEMERARRNGEECALAMVDIDYFKAINDSYGHMTGDRVLKAVVRRLYEGLRKYDSICRYGGEEFLVFLPQVSVEQAVEILERVRRELAHRPLMMEEGELRVTASFGITELDMRQHPETSIRRADAALYEAKGQGRNRVCTL